MSGDLTLIEIALAAAGALVTCATLCWRACR